MNAEKAEGSLAIVEKLTGTRAETCPWWSFHEPIVIDTLDAYPFFESGQLSFKLGDDPPAVMVEAIGVYHSALARVRDVQMREKDQARTQQSQHDEVVRRMTGGRRG